MTEMADLCPILENFGAKTGTMRHRSGRWGGAQNVRFLGGSSRKNVRFGRYRVVCPMSEMSAFREI